MDTLLDCAPPEFHRMLQGLPAPHEGPGLPDHGQNYRLFAMSNYIYAALDRRSSGWTDYTSALSPYLPATPSTHSLAGADAHLPMYILAREGDLADERIQRTVHTALPAVKDVYAPLSKSLPEMGIWSCPQCDYPIDPRDLTVDQRTLIARHLGMGDDCGMLENLEGRVELDPKNPWLYMRCIDCLGWARFAMHLRTECLVFWYPSPAIAYKSAPGIWWDEDRLARRQVYAPLCLENEALERTERYQFCMWKAKKMLLVAKHGVHTARFHLTRWRRQAVDARRALVRQMFEAGRGIIDTRLALVALMDNERVDAEQLRWQDEREQNIALSSASSS
ncbi:unnamed protein product [Peniophora sp. CBMAI 1063]|nr:unnamed protein product [Peniophora sp. CBMAI 1063]